MWLRRKRKEKREWIDPTAPDFLDVAEFHYQWARAREDVPQRDELRGRYIEIRGRFEHGKGKIQREYWGANLPIAIVLTEQPRGRLKRWLRRAPTMRIHHTLAYLSRMPVPFHAAIHHGDGLAVRAGWSLGDHSRHTVLDRIFDAQAFLFELADNAEGHLLHSPKRAVRAKT